MAKRKSDESHDSQNSRRTKPPQKPPPRAPQEPPQEAPQKPPQHRFPDHGQTVRHSQDVQDQATSARDFRQYLSRDQNGQPRGVGYNKEVNRMRRKPKPQEFYDWHLKHRRQTANPDRQPPRQSRLKHRKLLEEMDCLRAIMSVSEAILNPNGRNEYALLSCSVHLVARSSDYLHMKNYRVARPKQPLVIPWLVSELNIPESKLSEKRKAMIVESRKNAAEMAEEEIAQMIAQDVEKYTTLTKRERKLLVDRRSMLKQQASSHLFLVVAEIQHTPDNHLGVPSIRIFNSHPDWEKGPDGLWPHVFDQIKVALRTINWLDGPMEESQMTPILLASMEVAEETDVARQGSYGQPCGVHTILNGWAYCMGLIERINTGFMMPKDVFESAIELIELALAGHCDFWLIYWWMEAFQFIKPLVEPLGVPHPSQQISLANGHRLKRVLEGKDLSLHGHHVWVHSRLVEDGAKFFDQTIRFNDDDDLDNQATAILSMEDKEWELVKARTDRNSDMFSTPTLGTSETQQSTVKGRISANAVKKKIRSMVMDQFKKMTENPDFDNATLSTLTRACSHLAWFVRQRLNGGTVSEREVVATRTFEQLTVELLGRNFRLSATLMHAIITVVHDLLDHNPSLPNDVLRECMRSIEEGRYPDLDDRERIEAAKAAATTSLNRRDDNDDEDQDSGTVLPSIPGDGTSTEDPTGADDNGEDDDSKKDKAVDEANTSIEEQMMQAALERSLRNE